MTWAVINIDHDGDGIYGVSCVQSFVDEESAKEFVKGKKLELSKKYMTLANYNQSYAEAVVVPKDMKLPGWRNFLEEYCYGHNSYTTPETFTRDYKNALRGGTITTISWKSNEQHQKIHRQLRLLHKRKEDRIQWSCRTA
ncbi:MAG: hypothetical protein ACW99G_19565 [Candidatus Thorarchaeota archaeon]